MLRGEFREEKTPDLELSGGLSRHLRRVSAPDELWRRIENPGHFPSPAVSHRGSRLLLAAVLLAGIVILGFRALLGVSFTNSSLAEALAAAPGDLELRSTQPTRIRQWVRDRVGIDIPLSSAPSSTVQLVGAHVGKGVPPVASVAYRVGNRNAVLQVTTADSRLGYSAGHSSITKQRVRDLQVSSWTMRGQAYTLAYAASEDFRSACGICHSDESLN
jgi:hypothetical protein